MRESRHVAVIGTGTVGMRHLEVLRRMHKVMPVAIPMRSDRAGELREFGYIVAKNLAEASSLNVTHCIVATDTSRHVADSAVALENGFHVLVEKPLAPDAEDGKRLCVMAGEANRRIFVGCVLRFSESLNSFRALLHRVGRIHSVRVECQSYLPDWRPERSYRESYSARADEGGVLRDLIHEIDYAGWLFGWPVAVQARVRNLGRLGIESEEVAELMWETTNGAVVSLSLDYLTRPARRYMKAAGELGTLEWNGIDGTTALALAGVPVEIVGSRQTRDDMFLAQARAFLGACRGNGDSRLATGEDGVKALAICDAARRASVVRHKYLDL